MPSRATLLEANATALERAETREARRVAAAYRKARQELVDDLLNGWHGTSELTPGEAAQLLRQSGLLTQIDARLLALEKELGVGVRSIVTSGSELALEHIRQELALLPPSFRPPAGFANFATINTQMVERFVPVAFNDLQLGTRTTALILKRELQSGLIQGESFPSLIKRLMAATPTGEGVAVWRQGEISAELAVRRLVITAENASKQAALLEARNDVPEIRKQAIAAIGGNTTDCCLRVHGQIQPVDKPFKLTGSPRFADEMQYCPFHWRCRTSISMYHPMFEQSGLTTASMRASAAAQLAKNNRDTKGGA